MKLERKDRDLQQSHNEIYALKVNTQAMINELDHQNLALRSELMKMKNALLNPAQGTKHSDTEGAVAIGEDVVMESDTSNHDDSEFTCENCSFQTYAREQLNKHITPAHTVKMY